MNPHTHTYPYTHMPCRCTDQVVKISFGPAASLKKKRERQNSLTWYLHHMCSYLTI